MHNRTATEDEKVKRGTAQALIYLKVQESMKIKKSSIALPAVETLKTLVSPERMNSNLEIEITAVNTESER